MSYLKDSIILDKTTGLSASVEARKQTPTGNALNVQIGPGDIISNVPVFTLFEHHQVHEGETHQVCMSPVALAVNASIDFRFVVGNLTPTTQTPHLVSDVDSTGEAWVYIYETPTTTANGTQLTSYNRNRNSTNTPNMTVWQAPTVTAVGTPLCSMIIGSGEKAGGSGRESTEWDLKANTVYLVRITAKNAINVCARFNWYEDLGV
jgi:hypothetical protein